MTGLEPDGIVGGKVDEVTVALVPKDGRHGPILAYLSMPVPRLVKKKRLESWKRETESREKKRTSKKYENRPMPGTPRYLVKPYTLETSEYTNELCKPTWDPTSFTPRQVGR